MNFRSELSVNNVYVQEHNLSVDFHYIIRVIEMRACSLFDNISKVDSFLFFCRFPPPSPPLPTHHQHHPCALDFL